MPVGILDVLFFSTLDVGFVSDCSLTVTSDENDL
jgi:hypothetical protein